MNRRHFLTAAAGVLTRNMFAAEHQTFVAGIVPAGRGRSAGAPLPPADPVVTYWNNCDEVSALGFHAIEINNTRARIAEQYVDRASEFQDEMAKRQLTLAGLALFSHAAERAGRRELIDSHMLIGHFLAAVGGKYITHMLAPAAVLNEPETEDAYRDVDLRAWAGNANEIGKRLLNECGVKLAYHPEQGEVRSALFERILAETDERYFRFLVDTGHLASGGGDVVAICRKYRSRLECVHLKDFTPHGPQSSKAGNATLGQGAVDFANLVTFLRSSSFAGYVMSESGGTNRTMCDYMTGSLKLSI